jgi:nitrate reductase beta subunit
MRDRHVEKRENLDVLKQVGIGVQEVEDMYRYMAIANYEDRFVIPTTHREYADDAYALRGGCGFSFNEGCEETGTVKNLFGGNTGRKVIAIKAAP